MIWTGRWSREDVENRSFLLRDLCLEEANEGILMHIIPHKSPSFMTAFSLEFYTTMYVPVYQMALMQVRSN